MGFLFGHLNSYHYVRWCVGKNRPLGGSDPQTSTAAHPLPPVHIVQESGDLWDLFIN